MLLIVLAITLLFTQQLKFQVHVFWGKSKKVFFIDAYKIIDLYIKKKKRSFLSKVSYMQHICLESHSLHSNINNNIKQLVSEIKLYSFIPSFLSLLIHLFSVIALCCGRMKNQAIDYYYYSMNIQLSL